MNTAINNMNHIADDSTIFGWNYVATSAKQTQFNSLPLPHASIVPTLMHILLPAFFVPW